MYTILKIIQTGNYHCAYKVHTSWTLVKVMTLLTDALTALQNPLVMATHNLTSKTLMLILSHPIHWVCVTDVP
jgi:hypothetical protein